METAVSENPAINTISSSAATAEGGERPFLPQKSIDDLIFELGLWLAGLESFLNFHGNLFGEEQRTKNIVRDWTKEFRLTHAVLLLCSKLSFHLERQAVGNVEKIGLKSAALRELAVVVRESLLLNESLLRAAPLQSGEWKAWSNILSGKLKSAAAFDQLIETAEKSGEKFLPEVLRRLSESKSFAAQADLHLVLPRFGKILKWLSVVGEMLERDEPLKPVLLIFSRVYEQTRELIGFINNRLLRLPDEESELFGTLDGAAYTASIELRKVYTQELTGVINLRPAPAIYAKIETAYSLLNDSFQQTLVGFARLLDPQIEPHSIFPNFQDKCENSLVLRRDLWQILKSVQQTEHNFEQFPLADLNRRLSAFSKKSLNYLFYKDKETIERFIEEILITADNKDLVPILHRFGAYLETLFGQVNIRAVLVNYPFEPLQS